MNNIPEHEKEMWMSLIEIIYRRGYDAGMDYVMNQIEEKLNKKDSDNDDLK